GGGERHVTVLDQSGDPQLFDAINRRLGGSKDSLGESGGERALTHYILERRTVPPNEDIDQLIRLDYTGGKKDEDKAYLILPAGILDGAKPEYRATNTSDFGIKGLEGAISQGLTERRLERAGLDRGLISSFTKRVDLDTKKLTAEGGAQEDGGLGF